MYSNQALPNENPQLDSSVKLHVNITSTGPDGEVVVVPAVVLVVVVGARVLVVELMPGASVASAKQV